ncbi:hypothetical protein CBER1_10155 [Cercospora berteroae]|uniref:BZIP domain-containing protein n=1 Tax=Cercospora berteroae TaxID=357750 RepID=A0A2S6CAR7_9PEZI|nr:hypothetical protein CBER1_10155 [Cercospora berteroae]
MVAAVAKTPVEKAEELARVRSNQRRSRARRKEYVQELEERVRCCERQGVQATAEVQAAAKKIAAENVYLRQLLHKNGVWDPILTKPGSVEDLLPIDTQHLATPANPPLIANETSGAIQAMSPQPSPVAGPGLLGNYVGTLSTPPASLPHDTCGSQQTDTRASAIGNWSLSPIAPTMEPTEFHLPQPPQQKYNGAPLTTGILDMPVTSVANFDAAYGAQTYGDPTFAGMLATACQSDSPTMVWPNMTTSAQQATGIHYMNRTMPQGIDVSATATAGGARVTIPQFVPPVNMFAAMHHPHRTDHDPPPLSISHVQ